MKVVVIGAGILGASLAYRLTLAGAEVTVLDADRPGGGTSGATFAWTNAFRKEPRHYFELNFEGMREHQRVARELGVTRLAHVDGGLHWAESDEDIEELHRQIERLRSWGYRIDMVPRARLHAGLEPDLELAEVPEVARTPDEGWLEVVPFISALLGAARERGADLRFPAHAVAVEAGGGGAEVVLADGERLQADAAVLTTGPATARFASALGVRIPFQEKPGLLAYSRPSMLRLKHVIYAPGVHFRPDSGGRVLAGPGAHDEHHAAPKSDDLPGVAASMMLRVAEVAPAFTGTPLEAYRIGVRPMPADGLPVVGWIRDDLPLYALTCHSGVSLGSILGRLAAEEVLGQGPVGQLEPYRLARFAASEVQA